MKHKLTIKLASTAKEIGQALKIREAVFVKEQKVKRSVERDSHDKTAKHFLASYNNKPIGCARIRFTGKKAKPERIAVLRKFRGIGLGKEITIRLIRYCRQNNVHQLVMNSQYHARGFYEKCGFRAKGRPFMEAGIKHIKMEYNGK